MSLGHDCEDCGCVHYDDCVPGLQKQNKELRDGIGKLNERLRMWEKDGPAALEEVERLKGVIDGHVVEKKKLAEERDRLKAIFECALDDITSDAKSIHGQKITGERLQFYEWLKEMNRLEAENKKLTDRRKHIETEVLRLLDERL